MKVIKSGLGENSVRFFAKTHLLALDALYLMKIELEKRVH
jgi:hypothetical protein